VKLPLVVRLAAVAVVLTTLAACSEMARTQEVTVPAGTSVAVAVEPQDTSLRPSESQVFAATVTGAVSTAVRWSVRESGGGAIDVDGRYVAPATSGVFHVDATSVADPTVSAAATVTVTAPPPPPVVVTVTPSPGAVDACRSLALSASVSGTSNPAVTWSVLEGAAGGAVTPGGVYTAPSTGGTYHLVATSVAAPASSATSSVTVAERVVSVQVSQPAVTVQAGATTQLTATVTTTCGSFASVATVGPTGRITAD